MPTQTTVVETNRTRPAIFARIGLTPNEDPLYATSRAMGWNDVVRGQGFREAYETWPRKRQFAYERGRFQATLAKQHATSPLTLWKRDETLMGPLLRSVPWNVATKIEEETRVARGIVRRRKRSKK